MTHGGRGGTAEQSKAKMQKELTSYLVPGAESKYWADERDLNLGANSRTLAIYPSLFFEGCWRGLAGSAQPGLLLAALGARDGAW
jgi:hypothetical protein